MLAMRRHAALSTKSIQRGFPLFLVLAAVPIPSRAKAQVVGSDGDCATSRALQDLERVHAAIYAWYLDVVSGLAPFEGRTSAGAPLCPGSPPVDFAQVPPIPVEELRASSATGGRRVADRGQSLSIGQAHSVD